MLSKLEAIYAHYKELELLISSPEIVSDRNKFMKLNKEYSDLEEIVEAYFKFKNATTHKPQSRFAQLSKTKALAFV
jgi:peptide chain release factor 1